MGAILNASCVPAKQCPALCTRFLPEFAGTQLKILRFLVPLEQEPVKEQPVLQPSHQIQAQKQPSKARIHSTRLRKTQGVPKRNQKSLMSYFQPSSNLSQTSDVELPTLPLVSPLTSTKTAEEVAMATVVKEKNKVPEAKDEKEVRTAFWKSMLSGPSPMPLCGGHREPCVMRTVKKAGPNFGRHFYMCARPRGPPSDPSSRCNFFLWSRPS